jgi:hypothetical protein
MFKHAVEILVLSIVIQALTHSLVGGITSDAKAAGDDFTEVATSLTPVDLGSVSWGDYDSDGDLDVLLAGCPQSGCPDMLTKVFRQGPSGVFTDIGAPLPGVHFSDVRWGDYDRDGDLDIALAGCDSGGGGGGCTGETTRIFRNDGSDIFTDIGASLYGAVGGSVEWGDSDNDGDLDLLVTGSGHNGSVSATRLYINLGSDTFSEAAAGLPMVYYSDGAWGDFDNDGDLDIALTGLNSINPSIVVLTRVYRNDGANVFTDADVGMTGLLDGSVDWGDYDNDGDLDLLVTGKMSLVSSPRLTLLYRNNGDSTFSEVTQSMSDVWLGSAEWGDYDNDGDLDVLLMGADGIQTASIYRNNGDDTFSDIFAGLAGAKEGEAAWGDYDNDGDLDALYNGCSGSLCDTTMIKLYRNNSATANTPSAAPTGLSDSVAGITATLSWSAPSDAQTPTDGLTYNLRVGTSPGAADVVGPMANASTGFRRVVEMGNASHGTQARLRLPFGTYYWSVQAIDTAFAGSPFAAEGSFDIVPSDWLYLPLISR